MQALMRQLQNDINQYECKNIETVFIGGGTPSTIKANQYEPLFAHIQPFITPDTEITIEANPNSASDEWLKGMRELGVNRISFGVQSFDEEKLRFLGRAHTPKEAIAAVENAKEVGFEHINIDIIYDVKGDTKELLQKDIDVALALPIDHISTYALTIEKNTPFYGKDVAQNKEDFGYYLSSIIPFAQYEVSNYGIYQSRHNRGYWQLRDYLGIGAGAVGFIKNMRYYPYKDLQRYIHNPLAKEKEHLSPEDLRIEKIFLGLRSDVGVEKSLLDRQKVQILLEEKKIIQKANRIFNTNYFLADEIALFLL